MVDQVTPQQFLTFLFALGCGAALSAGYWYWAFGTGPVAWVLALTRLVKRLLPAPQHVMSRSENETAVVPLSSKDGQGDGRTDSEQVGRAELLTLYKILRKYGVPREEIRPALKAVRVPLSNDVWASAAPVAPPSQSDDDVLITPYAGRRTRASYYPDDPELEYRSP